MTAPLAEVVVDQLAAHGVTRIFGVPGGGSSLQIIAAAAARGIPFVLTRSEVPALIMAAVTGELTGAPGAALVTKGPGLANAMNGLAYASLDRAPLVLLADGFDPAGLDYQSHQVFDQAALVAPLVKAHSRLASDTPAAEIADLLDLTLSQPAGPVCVEFTAPRGKATVAAPGPRAPAPAPLPNPDPDVLARACKMIAGARRPVLVPGLQAVRRPEYAAALHRLADALGCPVLPTYKAKGILPDPDPRVIGLYVGGAGEAPEMSAADLIVLIGADPVEYALQPWRYPYTPVIDLSLHHYPRHYMTPEAALTGPLDMLADALATAAPGNGTDWTAAEMAAMKAALRERLAIREGGPITAQTLVEAALAAAPDARISVDAGAHMLPAMAFWDARAANDVLISNGLATMGFALPAAIAASLAEPARRVIAFTGDGGLAMCAGELATAAQEGCNLTVVVFNDSALSMIGVKQERSGMASQGVRFSETDFARVAEGMGVAGFRCDTAEALAPVLAQAAGQPGPALVDVVIDPSGYVGQVERLRG